MVCVRLPRCPAINPICRTRHFHRVKVDTSSSVKTVVQIDAWNYSKFDQTHNDLVSVGALAMLLLNIYVDIYMLWAMSATTKDNFCLYPSAKIDLVHLLLGTQRKVPFGRTWFPISRREDLLINTSRFTRMPTSSFTTCPGWCQTAPWTLSMTSLTFLSKHRWDITNTKSMDRFLYLAFIYLFTFICVPFARTGKAWSARGTPHLTAWCGNTEPRGTPGSWTPLSLFSV